MEIFRVSQDVYGQQILQGLNWNLVWVFAGAAGAIIVLHLLMTAMRPKR